MTSAAISCSALSGPRVSSGFDDGFGGCQRIAAHHSAVARSRSAPMPLLEVRLEQIQRRAEAIVARALLGGERRDEVVRIAPGCERGQGRAHELRGQLRVAGDVARVEERRRGREIVFGEARGGAGLACGVTDRELLVPQRIEQRIGHALRGCFVAAAIPVQDDEVDVRERRELASGPSAGGDERERDALEIAGGLAPARGDRAVVDRGQRRARVGAHGGRPIAGDHRHRQRRAHARASVVERGAQRGRGLGRSRIGRGCGHGPLL